MVSLLREPTNLVRFALMRCTTAAVTRASSSGSTSALRAATRSYNVVVILAGSEEAAGGAAGHVARAGMISSPSYTVLSFIRVSIESDTLYGNLTAISMPNLWLHAHIVANASYIA